MTSEEETQYFNVLLKTHLFASKALIGTFVAAHGGAILFDHLFTYRDGSGWSKNISWD